MRKYGRRCDEWAVSRKPAFLQLAPIAPPVDAPYSAGTSHGCRPTSAQLAYYSRSVSTYSTRRGVLQAKPHSSACAWQAWQAALLTLPSVPLCGSITTSSTEPLRKLDGTRPACSQALSRRFNRSSLPPCKLWFAFFHERAAAFDVVLAGEALRDHRVHFRDIALRRVLGCFVDGCFCRFHG